MEPFLVDFIYNEKILKIVRDLIIIILCGFITNCMYLYNL